MGASIEKWDRFEASFHGPATGNPFVDVTLWADFAHQGRTVSAPGFYDGDGVYRVRFMPDVEGAWSYRTRSNVAALNGLEGAFSCAAAGPGNHGPVRVSHRHHFAYADGTPYLPFGTTCYAWTHQPLPMQRQTLETLAKAPFNKLRMCVFPKHYVFNADEPLQHMYERKSDGALDFDRPNVVAFRHFEAQIAALREIGVEADVILLHPYDRWGYCTMTFEQDVRYIKYVAARLGGLRNVWWSLANEYDFLIDVKPIAAWDGYFQALAESDPTHRLRSIHNGEETMNYDHTKPWVDHVCIQNWNVKRTAEWRQEWGKPVVNDEPEYEGDIALAWGNLSAQELTHRFWITLTRGGYCGHGETYMDPKDLLWWAKGGILRGESWKRIAFLGRILEEGVTNGLNPLGDGGWPWTRVSAAEDGDFRLIYLGEHQPSVWWAGLPEDDGVYDIDVIDTWEMTVAPAFAIPPPMLPSQRLRGGAVTEARAASKRAIAMPGKPFQAIRIRRKAAQGGGARVFVRQTDDCVGADSSYPITPL